MKAGFLEALKAGANNKKLIPFPGTSEKVSMRVLSNAQHQAAAFAAEKHFSAAGIQVNASTIDVYEDEKNTQVLFRSLMTETGEPLAVHVDAFRELISNEEKEVLIGEYLDFEAEVSPRMVNLSDAEVDTLLADIKKNPESLGSVSNTATLKRLIVSLVSPQKT